MGFAPLPFDDRAPCFCHQNCPSFKKPEKRWWLVWTNPPPTIPELGTGVLVEFTGILLPQKQCLFEAVTLPVGAISIQLVIQPVAPIPGLTMLRQAEAITNVGSSVAQAILSGEECDIALNLPAFPPAAPFGACNMFPVRWYQNANDVPH